MAIGGLLPLYQHKPIHSPLTFNKKSLSTQRTTAYLLFPPSPFCLNPRDAGAWKSAVCGRLRPACLAAAAAERQQTILTMSTRQTATECLQWDFSDYSVIRKWLKHRSNVNVSNYLAQREYIHCRNVGRFFPTKCQPSFCLTNIKSTKVVFAVELTAGVNAGGYR